MEQRDKFTRASYQTTSKTGYKPNTHLLNLGGQFKKYKCWSSRSPHIGGGGHTYSCPLRKKGWWHSQTVFLGTDSLRRAGVSAGSTMMSVWAVADPTDLQASTWPPLPPHAYQTLSASALGLLKMGLRKPHTCYQLCLKLKTPALAGSAGCSEIPRPQLRG